MNTALSARADVTLDNPARWAKQLASHLGRHTPPTNDSGGQRLHLAGGSCLLTCTDNTLVLAATGPDEETLHRVQQVVGSHLERFAAKLGVTVTWAST